MDRASVTRALEALEAAGARGFDADGCDCIRALLTRAEELGGLVAQRLTERAHVHLERLEARLQRGRAVAEALLLALESERGELAQERASLTRGELSLLRQRLRKLAQLPAGVSLTLVKTDRVPSVNAYEASASELLASFAIARARDVVPEQAGPYNPLRIASDLLERIRDVSPIYLTAQLHRLDELGSMLGLPELPPPPSKIPAKKPRGSLKSG